MSLIAAERENITEVYLFNTLGLLKVLRMKKYLCYSIIGMLIFATGCGTQEKVTKDDADNAVNVIKTEDDTSDFYDEIADITENTTSSGTPENLVDLELLEDDFQFELEANRGFIDYDTSFSYRPDSDTDKSIEMLRGKASVARVSNYSTVDTSSGIVISSNDPNMKPYTIEIGDTLSDFGIEIPRDSGRVKQEYTSEESYNIDTMKTALVTSSSATKTLLRNDVSDYDDYAFDTLPQFMQDGYKSNISLEWDSDNTLKRIDITNLPDEMFTNHSIQSFVNIYGLDVGYTTSLKDCIHSWGVPYYYSMYGIGNGSYDIAFSWKTDDGNIIQMCFTVVGEKGDGNGLRYCSYMKGTTITIAPEEDVKLNKSTSNKESEIPETLDISVID